MIFVNKGEKEAIIIAKGNRMEILQEFAYLTRRLAEEEWEHGKRGEVLRKRVDAALMTDEEIKEEIEREEQEIMRHLPGTDQEKRRMLEAMLAIMERE